MEKWILLSINWTFCGDLFLVKRYEFYQQSITQFGSLLSNMELPRITKDNDFIDYTVDISTGKWIEWS